METKISRNYFSDKKRSITLLGLAMLLETIIFVGMTNISIVKNPELNVLIASIVAMIPVLIYIGKDRLKQNIFETNNRFKIRYLIMFVIITLFTNEISTRIFGNIEKLLNSVGYTAINTISPGQNSQGIEILIYIIILAPIIEEIIYRGIIMKTISKYSPIAGIVVSGILFGLMHMNVLQSPGAIISGFIFGYIAYKYSVKYSILVHIINNLMAQLSQTIVSTMPDIGILYSLALYAILIIGMIIILITCRKSLRIGIKNTCIGIKKYFKKQDNIVNQVLFSRYMLVTIIIYIICMVYGIRPK